MYLCPTCTAPLPPQALSCPTCGTPVGGSTLPLGTELAGKYRLESLLGQGGFGITYRATRLDLGLQVAVKEYFPQGAARDELKVRAPQHMSLAAYSEQKAAFATEGRILARFNHPSIVRVVDIAEENNTVYLMMEFLEGESLRDTIARAGRLEPGTVQGIAERLLDGLLELHLAGLLHKDIKPDNIMLTHDRRVVLIDFGAARTFTGETVRHTQLLTPGYAPLEQYASQARLAPYTDLYALSATLYHALTGEAPPSAPDCLSGVPLAPLPEGVPPNLREAIEAGLETEVTLRPQTAEEYAEILSGETLTDIYREAFGEGARPPETPKEAPETSITPYSPSALLLMTIVGLIIFIVAGVWLVGDTLYQILQ